VRFFNPWMSCAHWLVHEQSQSRLNRACLEAADLAYQE